MNLKSGHSLRLSIVCTKTCLGQQYIYLCDKQKRKGFDIFMSVMNSHLDDFLISNPALYWTQSAWDVKNFHEKKRQQYFMSA